MEVMDKGAVQFIGKRDFPLALVFSPSLVPPMTAIQKDGKWGCANQYGQTVIAPQYDSTHSFRSGPGSQGRQVYTPWSWTLPGQLVQQHRQRAGACAEHWEQRGLHCPAIAA